jgi:hypothetical protein
MRVVPIEPSRLAWDLLPDRVRAATLRGIPPADLKSASAVVAYGRFQARMTAGLIVAAVILEGLNAFVIRGAWRGVGGSVASTAIVVVGTCGVLAALALGRRSRRLIELGMSRVIEGPVDAPADLSIVSREHVVAIAVLAIVLVPAGLFLGLRELFVPTFAFIVVVIAVIGLTVDERAASLSRSADIDATGIWLGRPGMHIPWTSIAAADVRIDRVTFLVSGPVAPIDTAGHRWDERRHSRSDPRTSVSILTRHPEMVMWVAVEYADALRPVDESPRARDIPIRARPTVRQTRRRFVAR